MKTLRLAMEGLKALAHNPLRSLFMMMGTLLGIAALTVVMAMNEGVTQKWEERIKWFGTDIIRIRSGGGRMRGPGSGGGETMTLDDARAIALQVEGLRTVAPFVRIREGRIRYQSESATTMAVGSTEEIFDASNNAIDRGRIFTISEQDEMARVAVIGTTVEKNLFGGEDPLGKRFSLNNINFIVVGVLTDRGVSPRGHDFNDRLIIPLSTAMKRVFRVDYIAGMNIITRDEALIEQQAEQIRVLLRERHQITPPEEDDFWAMTATGIMAFREEIEGKLSLLLGALAGLCLLVGGVVLMNIMLVSVGERTGEIGLRRALGASSGDIFKQMLAESVVVNLLGMALGTGLGTSVFLGIGHFKEEIPLAFSMEGLAMAVLFAVLVGTCFGTLPAYRASRLLPVEALR
jgi:ABC-type antimicrobial peptide transport system permease subunit